MADYVTFKAWEFEPDVPMKFLFAFDGAKKMPGKDGKADWYTYGVKSDGVDGYLWPGDDLHKLIEPLVKKGTTLTITKKLAVLPSGKPGFDYVVEKNGQTYSMLAQKQAQEAPEPSQTVQEAVQAIEALEKPQGAPEQTQTPTTYQGIPELGAVMKACFKEAEMIIGEFGTGNPDIRQTEMGLTARCIFIQVGKNHN